MSETPAAFVREEAANYSVQPDSVIYKYIDRKTKASDRGSKARRSLGNLYALYVICEDYVNERFEGSTFTELMRRMKIMPFGAKLQNHPLDNRLNDEVRRQYGVSDEMLPVQPADLGDGKKARKISISLLSENGMDPKVAAQFVVASIDRYIKIIDDNQNAYLNEIENSSTDSAIVSKVEEAFHYSSDARLFEIISYALLHIHFAQYEIDISVGRIKYLNPINKKEKLSLFRTGRTNANDGGIDFVLKPLGKFFQVTETLDFRKFFLDFDKINRFPLSFVIKTDLTPDEVREQLRNASISQIGQVQSNQYLSLFDEIYTLNELREILSWVSSNHQLIRELKTIIVNCFKLEYGLLD
ncbi:hypothetical protein [uncultured Oceanisphaera sp.]|uniref:hypothetical protein n=1 Tax=uncultured Oceanisphaera sp. TaxID=353858 RepID=UPI002639AEA0|nr:hypothetical protein [uncultured Oceanisphaera sp.]